MQYIINRVSNVDWLVSTSVIFKDYKKMMKYYEYILEECEECIKLNNVEYVHIQIYSRSWYFGKWERIKDIVYTKDGLKYSGD